jgi:hypothetical protein
MAQTIQIKRTTGVNKPTAVAQGELFYAYGNNGTYGKRLSIGAVGGGGGTPEIIGGAYFTDMLTLTPGTLTANKAILLDANGSVDQLKIKAQGEVKLHDADSSHYVSLRSPATVAANLTYTLPAAAVNGNYLTTNGSGELSWGALSTSLTVAADSGSADVVAVGTDTLTFEGTANEVETVVSNNKITIGLPTNVIISGNLTVSGATTTVSSTTVNVADSMLALATGNNSSDALDIGFYGLYDDSGSQDEYTGLFRDAGDQKWKLFKNLQAAPTTTVDTTATGYAVATLVANLESASVAITGGSITGITDLAVADGGTGLGAAPKGSVLVANTANTLSALDGGGTSDKVLLYTASSDTVSWTNALDGGTYT